MGMAIEIRVLPLIDASLCCCAFRADMLVKTVVFGKAGQNVAVLYSLVNELSGSLAHGQAHAGCL